MKFIETTTTDKILITAIAVVSVAILSVLFLAGSSFIERNTPHVPGPTNITKSNVETTPEPLSRAEKMHILEQMRGNPEAQLNQ